MSAPIRVLIADDQRVVRDGLCTLVGLLEGVEVVGTAADGAEAVDVAVQTRPDVVLMDLRMPRLDGAEATHRIHDVLPDTHVLVLTTFADDDSLFPALRAGARGYLTKDADADEVEVAIRAVAAGRTHLDADVQGRLVEAVVAGPVGRASAEPPDGLSARELEVIALVATGLSNDEIATALFVSNATVKTHINHLLAKTSARDRAQLVRYAYERRLV